MPGVGKKKGEGEGEKMLGRSGRGRESERERAVAVQGGDVEGFTRRLTWLRVARRDCMTLASDLEVQKS